MKTPAYLFNTDEFAVRAEKVKTAFGDSVKLCFSIKANPFLVTKLPEWFSALEVCSPGELDICIETGTDISKIIFSGVNKSIEDVRKAYENGVRTFTAESLSHVDYANTVGKENDTKLDLLLRISAQTQFGMDADIVKDIIENRDKYPNVNIVGVHYFTGTQKKKAKIIVRELDYLSQFVDDIKSEYDFEIKRIEYGTGLYVEYFSNDSDDTEMKLLDEIAPNIKALAEKAELTVEMGRFFAANCGYYFTKVVDCKTNDGINFAICDGGMNQLHYDGQIQGMKIPCTTKISTSDKVSDTKPWTLCGSLCTTADVIVRDIEFDSLECGDVIVFKNVGAYSHMEGMAIFLSREMPQIWTYSKADGMHLNRDLIYTYKFNLPNK